jgi:aminoglycoside phosphotransferase (APT) family kinase protein
MLTGEPIGSGRTADVFAIDERWVLRRYRDGLDAGPEAGVMTYLAGHGYPVPRVAEASHPAAGAGRATTDLVMERLHGPSMLEALELGALTAGEAGTMLAELLHRLHAVPAPISAAPGHRVLHLDLHPDNVILTSAGPVVIDWANAEEGPPGLDRAMSALIIAQVAVDPEWPEAPMAREALAALLARFALANVAAPLAHLPEAQRRRAANPTMTPREIALLDTAAGLIHDLAPGPARS